MKWLALLLRTHSPLFNVLNGCFPIYDFESYSSLATNYLDASNFFQSHSHVHPGRLLKCSIMAIAYVACVEKTPLSLMISSSCHFVSKWDTEVHCKMNNGHLLILVWVLKCPFVIEFGALKLSTIHVLKAL